MNPDRCSKDIRSPGVWRHFHQCHRAGKVERDGKHYCGIHDPVAVQARIDKRDARWAAKRVTDEAQWAKARIARERAALCVAACIWMTDTEVSLLAAIPKTCVLSLIYRKI